MAAAGAWLLAQQREVDTSIAIDADDIGGTVASVRGAEAGVWVIAETTDTDQVSQDRRDRRSRALSPSRFTGEGHVHDMDSRLWVG
jgi:hypothetical protein